MSIELDLLIVKHLADMDGAAKRLDNLERRVFPALDRLMEELADAAGWDGKFDWWGKEELWLAPSTWARSDEQWRGHFEFGFGEGDTGEGSGNEDYFYLTRLCRVGRGQLGFRFKSDVLQAKLRLRTREAVPFLRGTPFAADQDGWWFMPVAVPLERMIEALSADDLERGLEPVRERIAELIHCAPAFEKFLDRCVPAESPKVARGRKP